MSLLDIISGDFGQTIELTMTDVDTNAAADVSSYSTSQKMIFVAPDSTETEKAAAFKTDGSDGVLTYTVDASFLTAGNWTVRGRVTSATAQLTSVKHHFKVLP